MNHLASRIGFMYVLHGDLSTPRSNQISPRVGYVLLAIIAMSAIVGITCAIMYARSFTSMLIAVFSVVISSILIGGFAVVPWYFRHYRRRAEKIIRLMHHRQMMPRKRYVDVLRGTDTYSVGIIRPMLCYTGQSAWLHILALLLFIIFAGCTVAGVLVDRNSVWIAAGLSGLMICLLSIGLRYAAWRETSHIRMNVLLHKCPGCSYDLRRIGPSELKRGIEWVVCPECGDYCAVSGD